MWEESVYLKASKAILVLFRVVFYKLNSEKRNTDCVWLQRKIKIQPELFLLKHKDTDNLCPDVFSITFPLTHLGCDSSWSATKAASVIL